MKTDFGFDVEITDLVPEFKRKQVASDFGQYNLRLNNREAASFVHPDKDEYAADYKRTGFILRKPSSRLDKAEFEIQGSYVPFARFGSTVQQYAEELVLAAVNNYINPTHVLELSDVGGYKILAVFDKNRVTRVLKDGEESLQFDVQPIIGQIFTGQALETAMKLTQELKQVAP